MKPRAKPRVAQKRRPVRKRPSRAIDLNALRIKAGKRGEGWCGCKFSWGDDLTGTLVEECAFHADARVAAKAEGYSECANGPGRAAFEHIAHLRAMLDDPNPWPKIGAWVRARWRAVFG